MLAFLEVSFWGFRHEDDIKGVVTGAGLDFWLESTVRMGFPGVAIFPAQTMHYYKEIPQNYNTFALFGSTKMGPI